MVENFFDMLISKRSAVIDAQAAIGVPVFRSECCPLKVIRGNFEELGVGQGIGIMET